MLLFALIAIVAVVAAACSSGKEEPLLPAVRQGNSLILSVSVIEEPDILYYQDSDFGIYSIEPSAGDRKLIALKVQAFNGRTSTSIMNVDEEGYTLLDKDANAYPSLNPFGERRRLSPSPPNNEELRQFIWGVFEIPLNNAITAWAVFDVPKDVEPYQLRWNALETIFVPFFPIQ